MLRVMIESENLATSLQVLEVADASDSEFGHLMMQMHMYLPHENVWCIFTTQPDVLGEYVNFIEKTYSSSSNNSFGLVPIASPTLSLFHDDPYMKVMHAYYAKESLIPPPTIVPPSSMLSPMFNPQEFFLPEELLPLKKQGHDQSPSSTFALPQALRIGKALVIIQQDFDNLEAELRESHTQIAKLQRKQMGNNSKIALARFRIANLEQIIEDIQVRHQADKESLLNAIYEHKNSQEGPSDY
ncbi:hypothetical protein Tco_0768677 [Tanacetum coccineum]